MNSKVLNIIDSSHGLGTDMTKSLGPELSNHKSYNTLSVQILREIGELSCYLVSMFSIEICGVYGLEQSQTTEVRR